MAGTAAGGIGSFLSDDLIAQFGKMKIPAGSCIVDKYIGETEKHLEQAFLYAEKTNMVLCREVRRGEP